MSHTMSQVPGGPSSSPPTRSWESMRIQLHPRDFQVVDLFHRGVEGRMVAATVGLNIWRVRWLRFRIALQVFTLRLSRRSAEA